MTDKECLEGAQKLFAIALSRAITEIDYRKKPSSEVFIRALDQSLEQLLGYPNNSHLVESVRMERKWLGAILKFYQEQDTGSRLICEAFGITITYEEDD